MLGVTWTSFGGRGPRGLPQDEAGSLPGEMVLCGDQVSAGKIQEKHALVKEAFLKRCAVLWSGDDRRVCQTGFSGLGARRARAKSLCMDAVTSVPMGVSPTPGPVRTSSELGGSREDLESVVGVEFGNLSSTLCFRVT